MASCTKPIVCSAALLAAVTLALGQSAKLPQKPTSPYDIEQLPRNTEVLFGKGVRPTFSGTVAGIDPCSINNGDHADCFGSPASQEDPGVGTEQFFAQAADDFVIDDAANPNNPCHITSVTTWVSFFGGDGMDHPEGITGFNVTIYENAVVDDLPQPAGRPNEDGTGTIDNALVSEFAPLSDLTITLITGGPNTGDYYQVDIADLDLFVPKNTTLWIGLAPQYDFETFGQIAVGLSTTVQGDNDAVQIFPAAGLDDWTATGGNSGCDDVAPTGTLVDLAFIINGVKDPGQLPDVADCLADCAAPGLATRDGVVDTVDLLRLLGHWGLGQTGPCDFAGIIGDTDTVDLLALLGQWGSCFPAPSNDKCADAAVLAEGTTLIDLKGATSDDTIDITEPVCISEAGDVWYTFTAAATGTLTLRTNIDIFAEVYDGGSCPPGTLKGCGSTASGNGTGGLAVAVSAGQSCLVRLLNYNNYGQSESLKGAMSVEVVTIDECDDRFELAIGSTVSGDTLNSTGSDDVGIGCGTFSQDAAGHWYSVIGDGNSLTATLSIETVDLWPGVISVYCGRCTGPLLCVGECAPFADLPCATFDVPTSTGVVTWCSAPGEEYIILIHSEPNGNPAGGPYTLDVTTDNTPCIDPPECGPTNDDCVDAITIVDGLTDFDTTLATTDGPENPAGTCNDFGQNQTWEDIWYTYEATCTGLLTVTTCVDVDPGAAAGYDTDIVVYGPFANAGSIDCENLLGDLLGCNDDDPTNPCGTGAPFASTVQVGVTTGSTYLVRVGGWGEGNAGPGTLAVGCEAGPVTGACCIDEVCTATLEEADCLGMSGTWILGETCPEFTDCPPANDDCDAAIAVTEETIMYDSTFATTDGPPLPESCEEGFGLAFVQDLWYLYTPTASGDATISLCTSSYDTRMAVYEDGDCASLVFIDCNDDSDNCPGLESELTISVTAGTPVLIRVGGFATGGVGEMIITQP